jgi:fatty acid-binding protein DegV
MANVAVLTDSTASIPEPMLECLQIHTVAYYIHRGQEVLRDLVTIQREEFLHDCQPRPRRLFRGV